MSTKHNKDIKLVKCELMYTGFYAFKDFKKHIPEGLFNVFGTKPFITILSFQVPLGLQELD